MGVSKNGRCTKQARIDYDYDPISIRTFKKGPLILGDPHLRSLQDEGPSILPGLNRGAAGVQCGKQARPRGTYWG